MVFRRCSVSDKSHGISILPRPCCSSRMCFYFSPSSLSDAENTCMYACRPSLAVKFPMSLDAASTTGKSAIVYMSAVNMQACSCLSIKPRISFWLVFMLSRLSMQPTVTPYRSSHARILSAYSASHGTEDDNDVALQDDPSYEPDVAKDLLQLSAILHVLARTQLLIKRESSNLVEPDTKPSQTHLLRCVL